MLKKPRIYAPSLLLCLGLQVASTAAATEHVVPLQEMEGRIATQATQRRANLDKVAAFLSMGRVEEAMRSAKLEPNQIRAATGVLSDEELAKLAARTERVREDIRGGALTNTQLTYAVIALVTALVVVIIFVA